MKKRYIFISKVLLYLKEHCFRFYSRRHISVLMLHIFTFTSSATLFGQEWKSLGLNTENISTIDIDWSNPSIIYVGSHSDYSSGTVGGIFRSTDGGASWDTLLRGVTVVDLDIHPVNANIIYATLGLNFLTTPGIIKTTDKGMSWVAADSGIRTNSELGPQVLAIDPQHPDTIYAGTGGFFGGNLFKSINGGHYWSTIGDEIELLDGVWEIAINEENTNIIYVGEGGNGDLFKSTNGGVNWTLIASQILPLTIELIPKTSKIFVGGYSTNTTPVGIHRSTDGGITWNNPISGLPDSLNVSSIQIHTNQLGENVFMAGNWRDSGGVYESDNEKNWKKIGINGHPVNVIKVFGDKLYAGSEGMFMFDLPTSVHEETILPRSILLEQNYPNPFNPSTTISYRLIQSTNVLLTIYNILGEKIITLIKSKQSAGWHKVEWAGTDDKGGKVNTGIYFCVLGTPGIEQTRKMIFLK